MTNFFKLSLALLTLSISNLIQAQDRNVLNQGTFEERAQRIEARREKNRKLINRIEARNYKEFEKWILNYYALEIEVEIEKQTDELFDRLVELDSRKYSSKEERNRIIDQEKLKLTKRALANAKDEIRSRFRRDFPNTPWGKIPK